MTIIIFLICLVDPQLFIPGKNKFSDKITYNLALKIIDSLEYIHLQVISNNIFNFYFDKTCLKRFSRLRDKHFSPLQTIVEKVEMVFESNEKQKKSF